MKEYIYVLKLVDRLENVDNWTNSDNTIVSAHFKHLLLLQEQGILIHAGKTAGNDKNTFGVCIFKAENFFEAEKIMLYDPAIKKGIMTGKLWEYHVALHNKGYKKD